MLLHILVSILLGAVAYWIAKLLHAPENVAIVIGIVIGVLVFFGWIGL